MLACNSESEGSGCGSCCSSNNGCFSVSIVLVIFGGLLEFTRGVANDDARHQQIPVSGSGRPEASTKATSPRLQRSIFTIKSTPILQEYDKSP